MSSHARTLLFGWSSFFFASALLVGCGGGPGSGKATIDGNVTYKGQPVTSGKVAFFNQKDEQIGSAIIQKDGTFTATEIPFENVKVAVDTSNLNAKCPAVKLRRHPRELHPFREAKRARQSIFRPNTPK